jgi:hypothetical protein
MAQQNEIL